MTVLLLAEHTNDALSPATGKAVTGAQGLGGDIHVLVAGANCKAAGDAAAKLSGVAQVLVADATHLANPVAEDVADLILSLAGGYDAIVAPATSAGKYVLARVAAKLDVMQVSDITKIVSPDMPSSVRSMRVTPSRPYSPQSLRKLSRCARPLSTMRRCGKLP